KNHKRPKHAPRRLVDVNFFLVVARPPAERQEDQPEHIERSEQRGEESKSVQRMPTALPSESLKQNRVLAEESGERRNARDGQRCREHCVVRPANLLAEAAHLGHFLLAAHGVNHGTGSKEEQRLEE